MPVPRSSMPGELRTVRVLLFIITGLALVTFYSYIVLEVDHVFLGLAFLTYVCQGVLTLIFGMLLVPGRTWLLWAISGYAVLLILVSLGMVLGGDVGSVMQLVLPGLILWLVTRPRSRECLRERAWV